jgi:hypothetical protein
MHFGLPQVYEKTRTLSRACDGDEVRGNGGVSGFHVAGVACGKGGWRAKMQSEYTHLRSALCAQILVFGQSLQSSDRESVDPVAWRS